MKNLMRRAFFLGLLMFASTRLIACDCEGFSKSTTTGNEGVLSFETMAVGMLAEDGCDRTFDGGHMDNTATIFGANGYTTITLTNLYSPVYGSWNNVKSESAMDLQVLTDFFATAGVVAYKIRLSYSFDVPSNWFCGYLQGEYETYYISTTIYIGTEKVLNLPTLCSGRNYLYTDVLSNHSSWPAIAPGYNSQLLTTNDGQTFTGLNITFQQVPSNTVSLVWTGTTLDGYVVKRTWNRNMYEAGTATWGPIPQNLSIQSPDVPLVDLLTWTNQPDYFPEFTGTGVFNSGPGGQWVFKPLIAGEGTTIVRVRVDHNGCKSEWVDAGFYVTPIVQNVWGTQFNVAATFGTGETGIDAKIAFPDIVVGTFPNSQIFYGGIGTMGKFHFICEGDTKTFYLNNPNPSLFYDWYTLHDGIIDTLGTGASMQIQMPSNPSINESQSLTSTPFPIQNNDLPFFLEAPGGKSVYAGDLFTIMVRARNVVGQTSSLSKLFLGVVPKPVIAPNATVCFDQGLELFVESSNTSYLDFLPLSDFRSSRWNIDTDPQWELFGDTIGYSIGNSNKVNYLKGQLLDTTKLYTWTASGGWNLTLAPTADIVCYSATQDIPIVRMPQPVASFNSSGITNIGSLVLGEVSGNFFDPETDSIAWFWSDDSNLWNNDSCWHYLNDLGFVSAEVVVIDEFGCVGTTGNQFSNYWYVPGTLSYEEEKMEGFELFPNPAIDKITIKGWNQGDIEIYDPQGKVVRTLKIDSDEYIMDVQGLPTFSLFINKSSGKYVKVLIKK